MAPQRKHYRDGKTRRALRLLRKKETIGIELKSRQLSQYAEEYKR